MRHDPVGTARPARTSQCLRGRLLASAAAGLAVVAAAGCSSATTTGGAVSATITVAAVQGVDTAPLYLAQKNGDFAAVGLSHVVIKDYPTGSAALQAVRYGKADIAASDYGNIFYVQSLGADLRVITDGYDAGPGVLEIMALPGGISSPAQLLNTTIGVPNDQLVPNSGHGGDRPVSLETASAGQDLQNLLGNAAQSVNWLPMSQQQEITALEDHRLPAILVTEPYISEAETVLGATEVMDAYSGSTAGLPLTGYVATNTWVDGNKAAVADFQAAIATAKTQAAMTGQLFRVLPMTTGMSLEGFDMSTIGTYPSTTSVIGLQRVANLLTNFAGLISQNQAPKVLAMILKPGS